MRADFSALGAQGREELEGHLEVAAVRVGSRCLGWACACQGRWEAGKMATKGQHSSGMGTG